MSPEHQNTADDLARELAGIKHIENRLERVEDENLDARELVSTLSQSLSSIEATLVIFGAQLKNLVNKPSRLGSIIAAVSVGITIFARAPGWWQRRDWQSAPLPFSGTAVTASNAITSVPATAAECSSPFGRTGAHAGRSQVLPPDGNRH